MFACPSQLLVLLNFNRLASSSARACNSVAFIARSFDLFSSAVSLSLSDFNCSITVVKLISGLEKRCSFRQLWLRNGKYTYYSSSSASFFTGTPVCSGCGQETSYAINNPPPKPESDIGNTGRPYYKCKHPECEARFYCFDDDRGVLDNNAPCYCGRPSRRRIAGKALRECLPLKIQYATGVCAYSVLELDQNGQQRTVPQTEITEWIRLGKI